MFGSPQMVHVGVVCVTWCISMTAAVLECACATGCNYTNMCADLGNCFQRNVALGRPATISSLYNNTAYNQVSGPACLAVNGNIDGKFKPINTFPNSPNCVHTADDYTPSYWRVDLGQSYQIHHITVYPREEYQYQLDGVDIFVDAATCKTINRFYYLYATCDQTLRGQMITLQKQSGFLMFCEVQVWVAFCNYDYPFRPNCPDCGHCKTGTTCDSSLNCPDGCDSRWSGRKCDQTCSAGKYGLSCTNQCGHCANDMCDSVNGTCTQGCQDGYQSPLCTDPCSAGRYGPSCTNQCGHCANDMCDSVNGTCTQGCQVGYQSPLCKDPCFAGRYGPSCINQCGHCATGTCDSVTGTCTQGCQDGYQSPLCKDPCFSGKYGTQCQQRCGYCKDNATCHYVTGMCLNGCEDGYKGSLCNQPCLDEYFGENCSQKCGNCVNKAQCNFHTGYCLGGCESGWKGDYCKENCTDGHFGPNCTQECGHCAKKSSCNAKTGYCLGGCQSEWQGELCNETIPDKVVNILAVAGSVSVICVILIATIAVIGIFKFRRRRQGKIEANTNDSTTRHDNSNNQNTDGRPSFELVSPQNVTAGRSLSFSSSIHTIPIPVFQMPALEKTFRYETLITPQIDTNV